MQPENQTPEPNLPPDSQHELDYTRYQLKQVRSAEEAARAELAEIKRSKAWKAIILYRKLRELPLRVLRKTGRTAGQVAGMRKMVDIHRPGALPAVAREDRKVAILTPTFFNYEGHNMFFGGAERYVIELVRLVRELGYEPEVFQCGSSNWERYYFDFKVTGLDVHGDNTLLSREFYSLQHPCQMVIYSPFGLATRELSIPTIGISHGIYWDQPILYPAWMHALKYSRAIIGSIEKCTRMVSVDTNTINWVRATSLNKAANCMYVPNFVDLQQFQVRPENTSGRVIALYPRRLYTPRGFWLISDVLPELLHDYPQLDFHFVGKADPKEEERVRELVEAFPGRVKWYFLPPEEMHTAYQQADIALIPTLHSEGTSLSCLEALASGNAVIATNVGGLPDLVLNGHNGLLIEPNAVSLRRALATLCEDAELRRKLQINGRKVAEAFDIERWRDEWRHLLAELLPGGALPPITKPAPRFAVVVPPEGQDWNSAAGPARETALKLAQRGYVTYYMNPAGRQTDPAERVHIVSAKDDLYLTGARLFLFSGEAEAWTSRLGGAQLVYDAAHNGTLALDDLLAQLEE